MRNRVFRTSPNGRSPLILFALLALPPLLGGCGGGGGGGGGGNPPPPNVASVKGRIVDLAGKAVPGAMVTLLPGGQKATTASDGSFSILNIALNNPPTQFVVNSPDLSKYFNFVLYGGKLYETDPARIGGQCKLPLPALQGGDNALPADPQMYSSQSGPPPPPPPTCP